MEDTKESRGRMVYIAPPIIFFVFFIYTIFYIFLLVFTPNCQQRSWCAPIAPRRIMMSG